MKSWRKTVIKLVTNLLTTKQERLDYLESRWEIVRMTYGKPMSMMRRELVAKKEIVLHGRLECYCCCEPITLKESTIEHIHPKSQGGTNRLENLALSHKDCNFQKGDRQLERGGLRNDKGRSEGVVPQT